MHLFTDALKLLTFRLTKDEMLSFNRKHFIVGLLGTWLVGIGRYWDDDGASLLQHVGLGSVIYIFILSFLIWLIIKPFLVEGWSYFIVLTFISLTSFPAIFYAIPVERFFPHCNRKHNQCLVPGSRCHVAPGFALLFSKSIYKNEPRENHCSNVNAYMLYHNYTNNPEPS